MNLDLMSDIVKPENEQHLREILQTQDGVLLAISEEWCSVCRVMDGTLINTAFELKGKAMVVKTDVATSQRISEELGLRSLPVYIVYKKGKVSEVMHGRQSIQALTKAWISQD